MTSKRATKTLQKLHWQLSRLSSRVKSSVGIAGAAIGMVATAMTVAGASLRDLVGWGIAPCLIAVLVAFLVLASIVYVVIGCIFKDSVSFSICGTSITIMCGDIFEASALRIIGCDTRFDTCVDDTVISKSSLHGQLVLRHGNKDEIEDAVEREAQRIGLQSGSDSPREFPLGSVVKYESSLDGQTYLMLAMTKLDSQHRACTNMAEYEQMLMKMWEEIDRVYAGHDIAMPILGAGITRFEDGPKAREDFLRCMLCTLNTSSVSLKSEVRILVSGDAGDIPLYEYRSMFRSISRR